MTKTVKTKLTPQEKKQQALKNRMHMFNDMPIWKSLLKMSIPSVIMMLVVGGYMFTDSILSAQFAGDSYEGIAKTMGHGITGKDLTRMFMNAFQPVNSLLIAFSMLFAVGVTTRVSINLGAKNPERAKATMKTGMMISMAVSLLLIPILLLTSKQWMSGQYDGALAPIAGEKGFDYGWIIIASAPMMFFNQLVSSLLRTEARNKQMLIAMVAPIFINLFFDWVFMDPCGMGIEGGAWATFIGTAVTTLILIFFIMKDRSHSMLTFKNMFGKFTWLPLFGVILVGVAPFFRNMAQSITGTVEMHVMSDVFTNNIMDKKAALAGVFPIFGLFFPLLFGLVQAAAPIASYNFGAKKFDRVKQVYWWSTLYAFILGILVYILSTWALGKPLLEALGTSDKLMNESFRMLQIIMVAIVTFGFAISGMVILSSTDRLLFSLIASTLRGIILFFPVVYLFRYLGIHFSSYEDMFWWFFPAVSALTSIVVVGMAVYTMKHLHNKNTTLDERIEKVYKWANARKERKSLMSEGK